LRIGVTGLARAGKTAFLTSVAANLLALGAGLSALPALEARLAGRPFSARLAPSGASSLPRFDHQAHLAALAADPPRWPERTDAVSLLAIDLEIGRSGLFASLPPRRERLEFIDYPGEWLLDLPLLNQDFATWSAAVLRRLQSPRTAAMANTFLGFTTALPPRAPADESLAASGHRLYLDTLTQLRASGLSFLQPGRFLMPAPGPPPPWTMFFPMLGAGPLASLMSTRFDAYRDAVRRDLVSPLFGRLDGLVVLADILTALHSGAAAYEDAAHALSQAAASLRWGTDWWMIGPLKYLFPGGIRRVAFAATKSDHVAARQRANLAALMTSLIQPSGQVPRSVYALASVRCTEDFVWTLEGRNISAVRGRVIGQTSMTRSYPGEVPDTPPDDAFFAHPFLALPDFEPLRLPANGRGGVPQIGLDKLLAFLLEDVV
jgi:predicted YcjX-like family ATPase